MPLGGGGATHSLVSPAGLNRARGEVAIPLADGGGSHSLVGPAGLNAACGPCCWRLGDAAALSILKQWICLL